MSVIKILDLVGESDISWQDAVINAVAEAAKTVDHIVGVEVMNNTATVNDGKIEKYRSNVHIAFIVDHEHHKKL